MKILNRRFILYFMAFLPWIMFYQCAQIGPLSGGLKDTIPPAVLRGNPKLYSLNVKPKHLDILFDEFIVLDDMKSKFYSSPPLQKYPKFNLKGKKLNINFNEELRDDVTYFFNFGSAIKDYREGNYMNNFSYVFSTGNKIDSMRIAGRLLRADNLMPEQSMSIMLYNSFADSVFSLEQPTYYAVTDSNGFFSIPYIKAGKYKLAALRDNDANLLFNLPNETLAFYDKLITPTLKVETEIDTLKAGSITDAGDTLKTDSIFSYKNYIYSPDDIVLLSFEEDHEKQYVKSNKRPVPGKLEIKYNIPPTKVAMSFPQNDIKPNDTSMQYIDTSKTQIIWIKKSEVYRQDSLYLHVNYPSLDSAGNIKTRIDTLLFTKKQFLNDTSKTKNYYSYELEKQIGIFENQVIKFNAPLKKIDTSKIKFVQLIDTAVGDARKQEILLAQRPQADLLIFKFSRKVDDFAIFSKQVVFPCNPQHNAEADSFWCKLSPEQARQDTLSLDIHFDNDYFFSQKQKLHENIEMSYTPQSINNVKRPNRINYMIEFAKKPADKFSLFDANNEKSVNFKIDSVKHERYFYISFLDSLQTNTDTLFLDLTTKDYPLPNNEVKDFKVRIKAIYQPKKQMVKRISRISKSKFYILFNKPIADSKVKVYDNTNKIIEPKSIEEDSLYFENKKWAGLDTLKLKVTFLDEYKKLKTKSFALQVAIKKKKIKRRSQSHSKEFEKLQQVTIEKQLPFAIEKDADKKLIYKLKANLKPNSKYTLKADSSAFTDIFDRINKEQENTFNVEGVDYYGNLEIKFINIGNICRETFYNEIVKKPKGYNKITEGKLIVQILTTDKELYKEIAITQDTTIKIDKIKPQKYIIKSFYDKNNDGKWNTGNYYKKQQPERVIFLPKTINIKSGWSFKYDWYINFNGKGIIK